MSEFRVPAVPGYQLEQLIGRGAAGEVWLARQRSAGGRVVAIKWLPTDDSRAMREQLRGEGELLGSLDHPHILTLFDVIDCPGGVALVMQYAGGGSLAALLGQRRLTAGQLVSIAVPLAEALAYAHARGVVHADVTPANVLFTEDGRPLLADFGIARAARRLVARSGLSGTPDYLDPELADGAPTDPRSDVYGLGVICWEALAGRPPYAGGSPFDVVARARAGERPSLRELAPDAPGALIAVIDAALAPRREGRYADAAQLARALASVAVPEPVTLPPRLVESPVGPPARPTRDFGPRPPRPTDAAPPTGRLRRLRERLGGRLRVRTRGRVGGGPRVRLRGRVGRLADRVGAAWAAVGVRPVRLGVAVAAALAAIGFVAAMALPSDAGPQAQPLARPDTAVEALRPGSAPAAGTAPPSAADMPHGPAPRSAFGTAPGSPRSTVPRSPRSTDTRSPRATDTGSPRGPTAVPSADWPAILAGLDGRRSAAFAQADARLLAEVYTPGDAMRVDTGRIEALAAAGERVRGLALRYVDVRARSASADRARLIVTDELSPYERVDAAGTVVQRYAGRGARRWQLTLIRGADGWRIAAIRPAR